MANRAYLRIWTRGYGEAIMLEQFEKLLSTIPFAAEKPGILSLTIQAVDMAETPLAEWDMRSQPLDASAVVARARDHRHADTAYFAQAFWDLWVYDNALGRWQKRPQELQISCFGLEFDSGVTAEMGHFEVGIGFEHLFTGHAGLLGSQTAAVVPTEHPLEASFIAAMSRKENLRQYHEKTRENIQRLMNWVNVIEEALPVERVLLWSEGEEDFKRRLDDIVTATESTRLEQ
ncbi:MAG TPA: hypothetical protein VOA41_09715 [Candidatus Dormibacteraeota bacterium]|nr:hypothetical protein [Candidatus Dormibacteraeota bacterium]